MYKWKKELNELLCKGTTTTTLEIKQFMKNKLNTYEDLIKFLSNYVNELEQELFSPKEE